MNIDAWDAGGETYDVEVYGGSIDFGGAVTFNQAIDLLFHARKGDVTLDQTITKSGGAASTVVLKASNNITQTATISLLLWRVEHDAVGGFARIMPRAASPLPTPRSRRLAATW